ncbi:MAG: carboxypeptidase regulatory-like domain-containing protein, partial [Vicinamibacterales bacterium]
MIPDRRYPGRRRRRWDHVSWWYSLIVVVPLAALIATVAFSSDDDAGLTGVVRDAFTGEPVSGAVVSTANATATTNGDGTFSVDDLTATALNISRDEYASTQIAVTSPDLNYEITLRPTTIRGKVTNSK